MNVISHSAFPGKLGDAQVAELVAQACPVENYRGQKILLIVPDHTRTAPVGLLFKTLFRQIGAVRV
jgi:lactate racemase